MVQPENIDSGHSSFQLDDRSGRYHCNLARLLIHALSRPLARRHQADKDLRRAAMSLGRAAQCRIPRKEDGGRLGESAALYCHNLNGCPSRDPDALASNK